jgi:hypothetical protein
MKTTCVTCELKIGTVVVCIGQILVKIFKIYVKVVNLPNSREDNSANGILSGDFFQSTMSRRAGSVHILFTLFNYRNGTLPVRRFYPS